VYVSEKTAADAKTREAHKKCATAPAKWKHFFDNGTKYRSPSIPLVFEVAGANSL